MIPFHLFRNKLAVIKGALCDISDGRELAEVEMQDAMAAVEVLLREVAELEEIQKQKITDRK